MKALDAGAYGVICPMVNSKSQAQQLVAACRYPPDGYRSYGPTRAVMYAGDGYAEEANDTLLSLAMIETADALDGLGDIVGVDGLDGVYVGPADLGFSLGKPPEVDSADPEMLAILTKIVEAAKSAGKAAGVHCGSVTYAHRMIETGFNFLTVGSDLRFLRTTGRNTVAEFRQGKS
jgi:4-hydroxy-2-oxoheptanedioate aldolase